MNKNVKILMVVLLVVAIVVSIGISLTIFLQDQRSNTLPTPATDIKIVSSQYLIWNGNSTRIFLASVSAWYGYSNETRRLPAVNRGDPIVIINAVLRNDYAPEDPLSRPSNGLNVSSDGSVTIFLTANIFSKGQIANAKDVSPSNIGIPFNAAELSLNSGETKSIDLWLSTTQRDIDQVQITLLYMGALPPP